MYINSTVIHPCLTPCTYSYRKVFQCDDSDTEIWRESRQSWEVPELFLFKRELLEMEHNFHPILKKQQQECCLVQYRSKLVPESSIRGCTWLFSYIFYTFHLPNYFRCNPLYAQGSDFFQPDLLVRHRDAGRCLKRKNKQGKQTKNTHTNRHRLLLAIYLTKKHCAFGLFGLTASSACFRNLTSSPVQRL